MNNWENLIKVALLGTHREEYRQDQDDTPLAHLLEQLKGTGPAHRLLCAAGTTDLYEQVGRSPERIIREATFPHSQADDRSPCSPLASYYLSRMLAGPFRNLPPEFLLALQISGQRVPDTVIPNLLAHGAKVISNRPFITPFLGARDRQLAAQNPAWSYASPDLDSRSGLRRIWDDSPVVKRQALIKQLRSITPDRGRDLLASTWKIDPDSQRIRMLKTLETGITTNDEPFLETALDDRNHQIRRHAAELLAFLPQSRLCLRMANRVDSFLTWTPDKEKPLTVYFPGISSDMVRDGVVGSRSKSLARIREQHLIQIVGAVPLSYWTTNWTSSPQPILETAITTNWTRTLFAGLSWAAYRQKDASWAKAVLWKRGIEAATSKLVNILAPVDYTRLIRRILAEDTITDPLDGRGPLVTALRRWSQPFDAELTQFLLPLYAEHFRQKPDKRASGSLMRSAFLNLARTCPPDQLPYADDLLAKLASTSSQWRSTVVEFLTILRFRQEMLKAVSTVQ